MSYRSTKPERCHPPTFLALLAILLVAALSPASTWAQDSSCAAAEGVTIVVYPSTQPPEGDFSTAAPAAFEVLPKDVDPWDDDGTSGGAGGGTPPGVVILGSGPVYVVVLEVSGETSPETLTQALQGARGSELR